MSLLLEHKNAIIYGGGGSIGGAVARTFAREGARIFLAGRTREPLEAVADEITKSGGSAEVAGQGTPGAAAAIEMISSMAALRRVPKLADVAEVAAFLASDRAAGMTGSMANVTCGLVLR